MGIGARGAKRSAGAGTEPAGWLLVPPGFRKSTYLLLVPATVNRSVERSSEGFSDYRSPPPPRLSRLRAQRNSRGEIQIMEESSTPLPRERDPPLSSHTKIKVSSPAFLENMLTCGPPLGGPAAPPGAARGAIVGKLDGGGGSGLFCRKGGKNVNTNTSKF